MNVFDADSLRSASHRNMALHLTAPFGGGAVDSPLSIDASGSLNVTEVTRDPILLAAPLTPLDGASLVLHASENGNALADLEFAAYTEAGAFLPVYAPPVDADRSAPPFSVTFTLDRVVPGKSPAPVVAADIAGMIEVRLFEGATGKLVYTLGAEKQRLRRQAREIAAMCSLALARDDALDRVGADLSVPRFSDNIEYNATQKQIVTTTRREPDEEYRRRVAVYRPLWFGSHGRVEALLNGPGEENDTNAGALHDMLPAFVDRFTVTEQYNPFAVAIRLVEAGETGARKKFLDYVRATRLVWPLNEAAANDAHSRRYLPADAKDSAEQVRRDLRLFFTFTADAATNPALAPVLCDSLVRVGRVRAALGVSGKWALLRAQKDDGGSRYELGLGANLALPTAAELNAMNKALRDPNRVPAKDRELDAQLKSLRPVPAKDDPEGRWLLEGCGLRTVHRIDANTVYVSHLPVFGLLIDGPPTAALVGWDEIVPGYWAGNPGFLAYERSTGKAQIYAIADDGTMDELGAAQTMTTGARIIAAGSFRDGQESSFVLYDPKKGEGEFWGFDGRTWKQIGTKQTGWRKSWSAIVPGSFGGGGPAFSDVMLYDPDRGELEFVHVGNGTVSRIAIRSDQRRTWTHATYWQKASKMGALFYDAHAGRVELHDLVAPGRLRTVAERTDFRKHWSHVVTGSFSGSSGSEFLFYDRETGEAELWSVSAQGELKKLTSYTDWPGAWTHLCAFGREGGRTDLVAYDRLLDRAGTFRVESGPRATIDFGRAQQPQAFQGHFYAAESQESNVVLKEGLDAGAAAWAAAGKEAWALLAKADGANAWQAAVVDDTTRHVFDDAGLPGLADPAPIVAQLNTLAAQQPDLMDVIVLGPKASQAILGGGGINDLRALAETLRDHDISSALPLSTTVGGNKRVAVVVGVIGLPVAGLNLSERRASAFRWYAIPLAGLRGQIDPAGNTTSFVPVDDGLNALVLLGYARRGGLADPYQFAVDLPVGTSLSLLQYEFLMNLLDYAHPAGVGVNTYAIRQRHVGLNGNVEPLPPRIFRTFRPFRRQRGRGQIAQTLGAAAPPAGAAWISAGGEVGGNFAVTAHQDGRLAAFTRDGAGTVRGIWQKSPGGELGAWTSLGGVAASGVLAARNADGRIDVFVRGTDSALWHTTQTAPNGPFGGWATVGGQVAEPIAVARNVDGRLELFAKGTDGAVWHTWQVAPNGAWSAWATLGGPVDDLLCVTTNKDGRLAVFAKRPDATVWRIEQTAVNNGWGPWTTLGDAAANVLAVGANADGRLDLFAGSPDGDLRHTTQSAPNGSAWSAWSSLQGSVGAALTVARSDDGRLEVFAARTDNGVEVIEQGAPNGAWGSWIPLGGTASRYAAVGRNADGRLELFVRGNDKALWYVAQTAPNDGWNG